MNGPADIGDGRADELHDFNFVTARRRRQPDDVGDRQRAGERQKRHDHQSRRRESTRMTAAKPRQPTPVVADVGDAAHGGNGGDEIVDGLRCRLRPGVEPHLERGRKRVALHGAGGTGEVREIVFDELAARVVLRQ